MGKTVISLLTGKHIEIGETSLSDEEIERIHAKISAHYRAEVKAEVDIRLAAEATAAEAVREMDIAQKIAASERTATQAAERRLSDMNIEMNSMRMEAQEMRDMMAKMQDHKTMMHKMHEVIDGIGSAVTEIPKMMTDMEKRLSVKPKQEKIVLPQPKPTVIPQFVFKPTFDKDGRIVSVTANPVRGG